MEEEIPGEAEWRSSRELPAGVSTMSPASVSITSLVKLMLPRSCFEDGASVAVRVGARSEDVSEDIADVICFRGNKELLRATPLTTVLRGGAAILMNSAGSAETYALSQQVNDIDFFISHNWVVPHWKKFFCLALQFNLRLALAATAVALALVALASSLGAQLLVGQMDISSFDPSIGTLEHGLGCTFLTVPTFLLVAFTRHELWRLVGFRGHSVFLDKTCIHQVNKELQQQGILKLGAFLRKSSRMIVLYNDLYLTKLWTVYEVACFLSLKTSARMIVVPLDQPIFVFGGVFISYMVTIARALAIRFNGGGLLTTTVAISSGALAIAKLLRNGERRNQSIRNRVAHFRVDQCTCLCEDDRPVVYHNISCLMRAVGEVGDLASDEEALAAFNGVVHRRMSSALIASIGRSGMRYSHVLVVFSGFTMPQLFDEVLLGAPVTEEEDWILRYRICWTIDYFTWCFGVWPLLVLMLSKWCRSCMHVKGCREWAFLCLGLWPLISVACATTMAMRLLTWTAVMGSPAHRDVAMVLSVAVMASSAALAIVVFKSGRRERRE